MGTDKWTVFKNGIKWEVVLEDDHYMIYKNDELYIQPYLPLLPEPEDVEVNQ